MKLRLIAALLVLCVVGGVVFFFLDSRPSLERKDLSFSDALQEMASLDGLAWKLPWRCYLASSYDREGGNEDKGQFERILPNGRKLVLDADGPGCVQRLWGTGMSEDDRLLFFFDGESAPRIDASLRDLIYYQERFPFVRPFRPDGSAVTYFPIPFRKSLRIEAEGPKPIYYQVTWRRFAAASEVETYPAAFNAKQTNIILAAGERWIAIPEAMGMETAQWHEQSAGLAAGESLSLNISGNGVIKQLTVSLSLRENDRLLHVNSALRQSQIRIRWDGVKNPSVLAPLGPFFCNWWRLTDFDSQPMSASNGTFTCRFPMPFRNGAAIEIWNGSLSRLVVDVKAAVVPLDCPAPANLMYFHGMWSSSQASAQEQRPHTVLDARGSGHYVGCSLGVESRQQGWLVLEGDETIRIDGEKYPSHQGTGLEDYFNDCWYYLHGLTSHPWHGLLEFIPYRSVQYRFHNVDAIPFAKSFNMTFERGHQSRVPARFESVAYWYLDEPVSAGESLGAASIDCSRCRITEGEAMAALFSMERAGWLFDAARTCRQFAQDHPESPFNEVMGLRGLLYEALLSGNTDEISSLRPSDFSNRALVAQAKELAGLMGQWNHAFLGFQVSSRGRLYLDGQPIAEVSGHLDYVGKRVELDEGLHTLAIEVEPSGNERWILVTVGDPSHALGGPTDAGFYDDGWAAYLGKPAGWPLPSEKETISGVKTWPGSGLPRPPYVAFRPNVFANMQSGRVMLIGADPHQRSRRVYLTKQFNWPGKIAAQ